MRKKYEDTVGSGKMTEQQFWAAFFHSHYVQRERLDFGTNELFADCASIDEKEDDERKIAKSSSYVPGDISNLEDVESGFYRTDSAANDQAGTSKSGKNLTKDTLSNKPMVVSNSASQTIKALIKRTNQYSSRFLIDSQSYKESELVQPTKRKKENSIKQGANFEKATVEAKRLKIDEICRLDDLSDGPETEMPKVQIQGPEKFSQFGVDQSLQQFLPNSAKEVVEATNVCAMQVQNWSGTPDSVLSAIGSLSFHPVQDIGQLSSSSQSLTGNESNSSEDKLSTEVKAEMQLTYAAANEVLSNFWQCFPVDSSEKEQKLERCYESIQKYETSLLENFVNLSSSVSNSHCADHLKFMMQQAHNKFAAFKNNKVRKK